MKKKICNRCMTAGAGFMMASLLFFNGISEELQLKCQKIFLRETSSYSVNEVETIDNTADKILKIDLYEAKKIEATTKPSRILSDSDIYTFSQGPVAWEDKRTWSGEWGDMSVDGNRFGAFGCGFCCMANIYCTLTDYEASPVDVYNYTKQTTNYTPSVGAAAVAWKYMRQVLEQMGMDVELKNKTMEIEDFQKDVEQSEAMIVLVNSNEDDSFWKDTPGHYVTIWRYDEDTNTVFVADSGDPDRNRQRIELETVYKALKMASEYQYLMVNDYKEENNTWQWNQITEDWISP